MPSEQTTEAPVALEEFRQDVLTGLQSNPKTLPSKYFYDQRGSQLFDQICELPEYYPTRTEIAIMRHHGREMADCIGSHAMLVELGSGSSLKTGELLERLPRPCCYVPVDISGEHLYAAADRIAEEHPNVEVAPVHADFSRDFDLPTVDTEVNRRVVYFPGSTIGNFGPDAAMKLLMRIARLAGPEGGLLIGFDLIKDREILKLAYDDGQRVTAAFNKNLLQRINGELEGEFDLTAFDHVAEYNSDSERIEMHLVSSVEQSVSVGDQLVEFAAGESIRTELSHKYHVGSFRRLVASAGFASGTVWTDTDEQFAVGYFPVASREDN